ncbi:MAG: hypothetical protein QOD76_1991, partial [Solirubrobacteraceae bacterium]|nr:hypothetical protein [Solirubrobacteraceae bacterium]
MAALARAGFETQGLVREPAPWLDGPQTVGDLCTVQRDELAAVCERA